MQENNQDNGKTPQFLHLGWDKLGECVDRINAQIEQSDFKPTAIVGISRGGLGLASFLANYHQVQDVYVIAIKRNFFDKNYDRGTKAQFEWFAPQPPATFANEKVLVADDITGDGTTLFLTLDVLKKMGASQIKTAVIAKDVNSRFEVDFQAITIDKWIIFPWERMESPWEGIENTQEIQIQEIR